MESYPVHAAMTLAGTAIMGFGVSLAVIADMVMNSGEAFVKAVSDRTGHNFGNVKIAFDVGCVALAAGLSLLLFRGQIIGVREGTVISALLTGLNLYNKLARFGGAGTLVPITGFANAVVSPAIDFKSEGFVTGMAAKMFTVAGPVIVFGTLASVIYGILLKLFG